MTDDSPLQRCVDAARQYGPWTEAQRCRLEHAAQAYCAERRLMRTCESDPIDALSIAIADLEAALTHARKAEAMVRLRMTQDRERISRLHEAIARATGSGPFHRTAHAIAALERFAKEESQ